MGKDKKAQRTKGNQKPSSSSRSAELNGGLAGFSYDFGLGVSFIPAASQIEDDLGVDANFRMTLRKLEKKDPITKLKALHEFLEMCEGSDVEMLITVLPFWPRIYTKLSFDSNEMVRADVQHAHHSLLNKTKKQFSPYLKAVMPVWLLVMMDTNTCVATRAKRAFEETFSEQKRPDVVIFCAEEILKYLSNNIFLQTHQMTADTSEESERKYSRMVGCSLKALGLFLTLSKASNAPRSQVEEKIENILQSEKFWAISKNKNALIRASWFNLVSSLIEYYETFDEQYLPKLSRSVFSSMDCAESTVLPHIWQSMLILCVKSPNCWNHCNKPEAVCSHILAVLRDGGRGFAIELYPLLRPLLKLIPGEILQKCSFYTNFFRAISSSLRKDEVLVNREEAKAIISAMFQCLSFLHKRSSLTAEQWHNIVTYQIIGHIKASWSENSLLRDSCLYRETALLLAEWSELDANSKNLSLFWELFLEECNRVIENDELEEIESVVQLFETFSGSRSKSRKFVEFTVTSPSTAEIIPPHFAQHVAINVVELTKLAYDSYVTGRKKCFGLFHCLITTFPSTEAFAAILNKPSANVNRDFLKDVILPMLNKGSTFPLDDVVKIFLALHRRLSEDDQRILLFDLKPTICIQALASIVRGLYKQVPEDAVATCWLKSAQLGFRVVREIQELFALQAVTDSVDEILENKDHTISLIRFIFYSSRPTDQIFSNEYLNQIVKVMRVMLSQKPKEGRSDVDWNTVYLVISLLESLLANVVCWSLPEMTEVFCILLDHFWLCSDDTPQHERLAGFVRNSLRSCVSYELKSDKPFTDDLFLGRFFGMVKNAVYSDLTTFAEVSATSETVVEFFKTLFDQCDGNDCDLMLDQTLVRDLFHRLIPTADEWLSLESSLQKEYATSTLCSQSILFSDLSFAKFALMPEKLNPIYPKVCLFLTEVLIPLSSQLNEENTSCQVSLGEHTDLCIQLLHAQSYISEMASVTVKTTKSNLSGDLEFGCNMLQRKVGELMQLANEGSKKHMIKLFRNRCKLDEYLWPISFLKSLQSWLQVDINAIKLIREFPSDELNYSSVLQIFAPFLTDEERAEILCQKVLSLKNSDHGRVPCSVLTEIGCLFQSLDGFWATAMVRDVFEILLKDKTSRETESLIGSAELTRGEMSFMICLTRLLSLLVNHHKDRLSHADWDFVLCHLSSRLDSLDISLVTSEESYGMSLLICAVSNLALVVFQAMTSVSEDRDSYPADLLEEWNLVYSQNICQNLFNLLTECSEYYNLNSECHMLYEVCSAISKCLHIISLDSLLEVDILRTSGVPSIKLSLDDKLQAWQDFSARLVKSSHLSLQFMAYSLLEKVHPTIIQQWENNSTELSGFDIPEFCTTCIGIITEAEEKIEAFLDERTAEEKALEIRLVPHTEEYSCWTSYLLAFNCIFTFCKVSSEKNQHLFATSFGKMDYLHTLLNNLLFLLLPLAPLDECSKERRVDDYFANDFDCSSEVDKDTLLKLAARNYLLCLDLMPAETRYWFRKLEKLSQQSVEKLTRVYVSPIIISREFKLINEGSSEKFNNMSVKTKERKREVVATYVIDDTKLDLVLNISPKHPLTPVTFDHTKMGIAAVKWRTLNMMLQYRNTTLLNSLLYWKKNVDQKFVGVEECFICYSILQSSSKQVPKLSCRTCRNKFHSGCLYKWFDTASKTTCPICRSPF